MIRLPVIVVVMLETEIIQEYPEPHDRRHPGHELRPGGKAYQHLEESAGNRQPLVVIGGILPDDGKIFRADGGGKAFQ